MTGFDPKPPSARLTLIVDEPNGECRINPKLIHVVCYCADAGLNENFVPWVPFHLD